MANKSGASDDDTGPAAAENEVPVVLPIEDWIDLHTFSPKDVPIVVEEYLNECYRLGRREVRIVHGRGIGVQREIVRSILSRTPHVESFRDAPPASGGWGATLARLKANPSPSGRPAVRPGHRRGLGEE